MKRDAVSAKLVMIMNLLATPLRTSIEFMVLPVTGIMKIISAIYSSGILTNPKRGKERWGLYAPSKIIGIADIARATGLNQPPRTLQSSISPTTKAIDVVIIIANISTEEKEKKVYKVSSDAKIPTSIEGPPGLGTIAPPTLLYSF